MFTTDELGRYAVDLLGIIRSDSSIRDQETWQARHSDQ
jgi:hypothetical protein